MKLIGWLAVGVVCVLTYNELKNFFGYQPPGEVDRIVETLRDPIDRWVVRTYEDVKCVGENGESVVYKTIERLKIE